MAADFLLSGEPRETLKFGRYEQSFRRQEGTG